MTTATAQANPKITFIKFWGHYNFLHLYDGNRIHVTEYTNEKIIRRNLYSDIPGQEG